MQQQEIEILEKHTQALNALTEALRKESVNFPLDKALWNAETCAAYIGVSKEYFAQYIASKPGFPASAKIGHRKWNPGNYISSYTNANTAGDKMTDDLLYQKIYKHHTQSRPCVIDGCPDAKTVWLFIDGQQFCITPHSVENEEEAENVRKMLTTAIVKLIRENRGMVKP